MAVDDETPSEVAKRVWKDWVWKSRGEGEGLQGKLQDAFEGCGGVAGSGGGFSRKWSRCKWGRAVLFAKRWGRVMFTWQVHRCKGRGCITHESWVTTEWQQVTPKVAHVHRRVCEGRFPPYFTSCLRWGSGLWSSVLHGSSMAAPWQLVAKMGLFATNGSFPSRDHTRSSLQPSVCFT